MINEPTLSYLYISDSSRTSRIALVIKGALSACFLVFKTEKTKIASPYHCHPFCCKLRQLVQFVYTDQESLNGIPLSPSQGGGYMFRDVLSFVFGMLPYKSLVSSTIWSVVFRYAPLALTTSPPNQKHSRAKPSSYAGYCVTISAALSRLGSTNQFFVNI